ncbi:hypothetical protein NB703_004467 [Pantoea ananatis]|uniref:Uncharacterized protein n=1 Tax=Pantoea ananas TaxID=553 RepID=A0AAJ1D344_PANAN|nr:hypothetical protein [Pantoea ananatis]MCW0346374.1 hypothetical protein [Pantoea ananatis]
MNAAGAAFSQPIVLAPLVITFCGSNGTRAQLHGEFEGDPDAAAEIFIEAMTRRHSEQWNVTCSPVDKFNIIPHGMPQIKDAIDWR